MPWNLSCQPKATATCFNWGDFGFHLSCWVIISHCKQFLKCVHAYWDLSHLNFATMWFGHYLWPFGILWDYLAGIATTHWHSVCFMLAIFSNDSGGRSDWSFSNQLWETMQPLDEGFGNKRQHCLRQHWYRYINMELNECKQTYLSMQRDIQMKYTYSMQISFCIMCICCFFCLVILIVVWLCKRPDTD